MHRAMITVALVLLSSLCIAGELPETSYPNIVRPIFTINTESVRMPDGAQLALPRGAGFVSSDEILVSDCASNRVYRYRLDHLRRSIEFSGSFGGFGSGDGAFQCPGPLAIGADGRIYVGDLGNHRIEVFDRNFSFISKFGALGSGGGQFGNTNHLYNSSQIALADQRLFVTDPGNNRVEVFSLDGQFLFEFGAKGEAPGEFTYPNGIAVTPNGTIIVSDMYNQRIQTFSATGQPISHWGDFGSYVGQFAGPAQITFADGEVLVADAVNHRIQAFDQKGTYLYQFGRHPTTPHEGNGRLHYPMVIAAQPSGPLVIVCEKFEERCQIFDRFQARRSYQDVTDSAWWEKYPYFHYRTSAQILRAPKTLGTHDWLVMSEEELHRVVLMDLADPTNTYAFGEFGTKPGQFKMPQGAFLDPFDRVWVSDTLNDRLQLFKLNGEFIKVLGQRGSAPGEFSHPGELVIDRLGTVYVLDPGNGRIQVLDKDGNFVRQIGKPGQGVGELNFPIGLALSPEQDTLYVVELYQPRVQAFSVDGKTAYAWGEYGTAKGMIVLGCHTASASGGGGGGGGGGGAARTPDFVYITDDALNRVTKFDSTGKYITSWGRLGVGPGEFYHPQGIAVDAQNRIWVLDYGNHRGQMFDADGRFLGFFADGKIGSDTNVKAYQK